MSSLSVADVPLHITSTNATSERRVTPSWTISQLKARLEPITGIPPQSQKLTLRLGSQDDIVVEAEDEDRAQLAGFPLQAHAELHVSSGSVLLAAKEPEKPSGEMQATYG